MKRKGSGWVSSLWREAYARDCKFAVRLRGYGVACAEVQSIAIEHDSSRALDCVVSVFVEDSQGAQCGMDCIATILRGDGQHEESTGSTHVLKFCGELSGLARVYPSKVIYSGHYVQTLYKKRPRGPEKRCAPSCPLATARTF
jgi:hypothetical protein